MELTKEQIREIEKAAAKFLYYKRPPEEIRDKVDLAWRVDEQSVYIFEIRPKWDDPLIIIEEQIAKATYVKTEKHWKIFWMKRNLQWTLYKPIPSVKLISDFFNVVSDDESHTFFG